MKETTARSLVKALTWRFINIISDFGLAFIFTRKIILSIEFATVAFFLAIFFYFVHERAWNDIKWGRKN